MKMVMKRSLLIIGVVCAILLAAGLVLKSSIELHEAFGVYSVALALLAGLLIGAFIGTGFMAMMAASGSASRDEEYDERLLNIVQKVKEDCFKKGYESGLEDGKAQENEEWHNTLNSLTNKIIQSGADFDRALAEEYFENKHQLAVANG